jgi:hypothetical protein
LNGGNPDTMTLRRFIDAAYAILVGEYQRLGMDLLTAIEKVGELGGETPVDKVGSENARAMEQLMGMMGGVKGAPV